MTEPESVKAMFGRIAPTYDRANRVLSARRDVAWRRHALGLLTPTGTLLDLACGTFDIAQEAVARGIAQRVHGCDFSVPMLQAGQAKRAGQPISACAGDASRLPFAAAAVDVVTIGYGWRNFPDPAAALTELARVLRPGGELLILDFFRPTRWFPRLFYATFGRWIFPIVGGLVSGDRSAYRYLHDSVQRFLTCEEARRLLEQAGFEQVRVQSYFGGVSHALVARRAGGTRRA